MPGAENHITNKDPSYFFKSQHSINSFSEKEISRFVEQGLIIEGRQLSITWEENGSNKQIK